MGYRYKTCDYCSGDHAVMDCQKLENDAKKYAEQLKAFSTKERVQEYVKGLILRQLYDRSEDDHDIYVPSKGDWDGKCITGDYEKHFKRFYERSTWYDCDGVDLTLIGTEEEQLKFCQEVVENAQPTLTYEEYREVRRTPANPRRMKKVIRKHEDAKEAKEKRAKKSCSYCRGSGHTVRTCQKHKDDLELHKKAYMIYSYYTARALSRFGFWTGCMVNTPEKGIRVWTPQNAIGNAKNLQVLADTSMLTEDQIDFIHLTRITDNLVYFNKPDSTNKRHWFGHSTRFDIGTSPSSFETIDWENNKLPTSPHISAFFGTKISVEHVYKVILGKYNAPTKGTTKYSECEFSLWQGSRIIDNFNAVSEGRRSYGVYGSATDYYDKKLRIDGSWEILEKYVKENEHILNKISNMIV